jgi:isoleucyl-tRNA synthetase
MEDVSEGKDFNFPKEEETVLKFWKDIDAFKQQLKLTEGKKEYVFFDGPPFATGLPHYGHILAGTLKVCRQRRPASPRCHAQRIRTQNNV